MKTTLHLLKRLGYALLLTVIVTAGWLVSQIR